MTDLPRFSLTLPEELLDVIEDYQKQMGFKTRNKAIVHLLASGINDLFMEKTGMTEDQAELIQLTMGMDPVDVRALIEIAKRFRRSSDLNTE